jgi:23S rRNA (cytidine1920-2'-O)/16S rRNA (cytidine1409-2'-O)-methyltransferase
VSKHQRAPFVALTTLLRRRFPDLDDPDDLVRRGLVLVNEAPTWNPRARVRADASVRLLRSTPLRGTVKLSHALRAFGLDVTGLTALDLGAAAGGFTQALLDGGARRVYAVDVGVGQLRGVLRNDPRVVNLERTNLSQLSPRLVPDPVEVVTMDLSYLSIADALLQVNHQLMVPAAELVALVKPTYELHAGTLAAQPENVADAVVGVKHALVETGWQFVGQVPSPIAGANGAVEAFVLAQRPSATPARTGVRPEPRRY